MIHPCYVKIFKRIRHTYIYANMKRSLIHIDKLKARFKIMYTVYHTNIDDR